MDSLLPPPENAGMPWSKLVEAGWRIKHLSHAQAGRLDIILKKDAQIMSICGPDAPELWTKLEVQAGIQKRSALPPKPEKAPADPRHKQFIEAWSFAYTQHFQARYTFNGPIDGKALKTFLSANDADIETIINTAREAWKRQDEDPFCKACKQSVSIRGFFALWNEIRAELTRNTRQGNGSGFSL